MQERHTFSKITNNGFSYQKISVSFITFWDKKNASQLSFLTINSCTVQRNIEHNGFDHFNCNRWAFNDIILLFNIAFWLLEESRNNWSQTETICWHISEIGCVYAKFPLWSGQNLSVSVFQHFKALIGLSIDRIYLQRIPRQSTVCWSFYISWSRASHFGSSFGEWHFRWQIQTFSNQLYECNTISNLFYKKKENTFF